jgi:hypothetical protein
VSDVRINPYASPMYSNDQWPPAAEGVENAVFRKGNLLVMNKRARLPDRCVKTNRPTTRRLKRKLVWFPRIVNYAIVFFFLVVPAGILVSVVLWLIFRKQATIHIGLCDACFRRRRWAIAIGWGSFLGMVALVAATIAYSEQVGDQFMWLMGLVIFFIAILGLCGIFYGVLVSRMIVAKRITSEMVWIEGVHSDFLDTLPPWPYHP